MPIATTPPTAVLGPTVAASPVASPTAAPGPPISVDALTIELPTGFTIPTNPGFTTLLAPTVDVGPIASQAADVVPPADFVTAYLLSDTQRNAIVRAGFVVSPADAREFFEVYERNRYDFTPSFVSSDVALHAYHQVFDSILRVTETEAFSPTLVALDSGMLDASVDLYNQLAGSPWQEAARRNAAYFALPIAVLRPDWPVPAALADLVEPDLAAVRAHATQSPSTIFPDDPRGEDWTQYTPRGHYTRSEDLTRYFQAMMWHGRRSFSAEAGRDETVRRQELLLLHALATTKDIVAGGGSYSAVELYRQIYEPTSFFVGETDGLNPLQALPALAQVYGDAPDLATLTDDARLATLRTALAALRTEQIRDLPSGGPVEDPENGIRFIGQRLVPDALVFTNLLDPKVPGRQLPKSLDLFAAMGSARAQVHLAAAGDLVLPNYAAQLDLMRADLASTPEATWNATLYYGWLNTFRPILQPAPVGAPRFTQNEAWTDKQLATVLGSWAQLKHDTLLYAKQVAVEAGFVLEPPRPDLPRGYVEPVPDVFARITTLSENTRAGLSSRGLLSEAGTAQLAALSAMMTRLQAIAEAQLRGETVSDADHAYLFTLGIRLEDLTFATDADRAPYSDLTTGLSGETRGNAPVYGQTITTSEAAPPNAAIVADIATSPSGIAHVGVGRIHHIFVLAPVDGKLVLTRGGVFSSYEFVAGERLSDEDWRAQLDAGEAPPLPVWQASFRVDETAATPLMRRIVDLNSAVTRAFFYASDDGLEQEFTGAELTDTQNFVRDLQNRRQFIGMQRLELSFLSFDQASPTEATVTTRERWREDLYDGVANDLNELPQPSGMREYTATTTYNLVLGDAGWRVSRVQQTPVPPGFR